MRGLRLNRMTPWLTVLVLSIACVTSVYIPFSQANWNEVLGIEAVLGIAPQPGTSLAAEKTAQGFWELAESGDHSGVRGQVCVTNQGNFPTENLAIMDSIQVKLHLISQFSDYRIFPIDVSAKPMLAPGETYCYPYEYSFSPFDEPKAKYRNTAQVTITNHAGWLPGSKNCPGPEPCPFGPNPKAPFTLPDSPAVIRLPENPAPPRLGVLTPTAGGIIESTAPATAKATAEATAGATAETTATPSLQPSITPTPTSPPGNLRATPTPAPTLEPESTCVYSADYWKDHPQKWPVGELSLGGDTYSRQQALELLALEPGEDTTLLLARQLIAARLNLANGAEGDSIEMLLLESDEWLEDHPLFSNPKDQPRKMGRELASRLEEFNTGESGPEACPLGKVSPTSAPTQEMTASSTPTPTLILTATWTPTFTLEPPTETALVPPTETSLPPSPTPEALVTPSDTPVPDLPTPTPAPTQEPLPTEPPPLATEEPTPLPR